MTFTEVNHYVPEWYQKRFLPNGLKEQKYYYLDLAPEKIIHADGNSHFRKSIRRLGPRRCFQEKHLYTLRFGKYASDVVEKNFFGKIDDLGAKAVALFSNFSVSRETTGAFQNLLHYLNSQKLRTPKGLDFLKMINGDGSHQNALQLMGKIWQIHGTLWAEGVWEILECDQSETKFIVSDHPVTTYNKKLFPGDKRSKYPLDADIKLVGTQTLFPLDLNRCLVITNLGYVRNPRINPISVREKPRYFVDTMFFLPSVQTGRQLTVREVRAINYIIKKRAKRYIAAGEKEWLYPENFLKETLWNKLGDRFFLMPDPRKVPFTTSVSAAFSDGSTWRSDEYGRNVPKDDPKVKALRDSEMKTFFAWQKEWDEKFGKLTVEELRKFL